MIVVSGFDLATRLCGWCSGSGDTIPDVGAWELPDVKDDLGWMIDSFHTYLCVHIERFRPSTVVYEAPILVVNDKRRGTDKLLTLRKLYSLGPHLEWVFRTRGIECGEESLQAIKREVTGNRHADKDAMVAMAVKVGLKLPATKSAGREDAADAWGAWLLGLRHVDKGLSGKWDRLLYSPNRGFL